ncbi:MAG: helix-turn-helix domain-containing protein [Defluviitaleaceae bacterium]|nr:helix-turn-helix domain-containing protein [Defluviitaleaceae bacterium]
MSKRMGEELVEAMQELLNYSEGKVKLRTTHIPITPVCEAISPTEIKAVRENLKMSQSMFAQVIGVSKKTVESWEAGRYKPDGAARRLISIMQQDPDFPEKYELVKRA